MSEKDRISYLEDELKSKHTIIHFLTKQLFGTKSSINLKIKNTNVSANDLLYDSICSVDLKSVNHEEKKRQKESKCSYNRRLIIK